jgi:hypothetical protein
MLIYFCYLPNPFLKSHKNEEFLNWKRFFWHLCCFRVSKTERYCLSRICFQMTRHVKNWAEYVVDERPTRNEWTDTKTVCIRGVQCSVNLYLQEFQLYLAKELVASGEKKPVTKQSSEHCYISHATFPRARFLRPAVVYMRPSGFLS